MEDRVNQSLEDKIKCHIIINNEEPTTRARTRLRTLSPISGEMSLPNCCSVVRKRFSLLSWRAPQVAGSCWFASDEEDEEDGPLLYRCGGDGTAFRVGGEWWFPLVTGAGKERWRWTYLRVDIFFHITGRWSFASEILIQATHLASENIFWPEKWVVQSKACWGQKNRLSGQEIIQGWPLHVVVEKEAGRGPLGLTEGRGGMVELALLLGADLEWVLASTGEPGMAGLFFSLLSAERDEREVRTWMKH